MKKALYLVLILISGTLLSCKDDDDCQTPSILSEREQRFATQLASAQWDLSEARIFPEGASSAQYFTKDSNCQSVNAAFTSNDLVSTYRLSMWIDGLIAVDKKMLCSGEWIGLLWKVSSDASTAQSRNLMSPGDNFIITEMTTEREVINVYSVQYFNLENPLPTGEAAPVINSLWLGVNYSTEELGVNFYIRLNSGEPN